MSSSKIFITGANGQLGTALREKYPQALCADVQELDITDQHSVEVYNWSSVGVIINAAAYTAVDLAEDQENKAMAVNAIGPRNLALACKQKSVLFIHISTDYVFDGTKKGTYNEKDATHPINKYGNTKLLGEQNVLALVDNIFRPLIFRTSWVYSRHGNNFVKTMQKLMQTRSEIEVVDDQHGSPTFAADLAHSCLQVLKMVLVDGMTYSNQVYHFSNEGYCSWYEFALEIARIIGYKGKVTPISSSDYSTRAKRPSNSMLDCNLFKSTFNIPLQSWKHSLESCLTL